MGMVISFVRAKPEELDKALVDRVWLEEFMYEMVGENATCYLDKAWDGMQFLLDAADIRISLLEDGEPLDDDGVYAGWTVDQVRDAARQLRAIPFDRLAQHFDPDEMTGRDIYPAVIWQRDNDALDYLRHHHLALVEFFEQLAASRSAAIRTFSY